MQATRRRTAGRDVNALFRSNECVHYVNTHSFTFLTLSKKMNNAMLCRYNTDHSSILS